MFTLRSLGRSVISVVLFNNVGKNIKLKEYMPNHHDESPFYGVDILRAREQEYIQQLLKKYRTQKADENLKKTIYDELQNEKFLGRIKIPFKVVLQQDPTGKYPDAVEVILDTKV